MQKKLQLSIIEQRDAIGQRLIRKLSSVLASHAHRNTLLLVLDQFDVFTLQIDIQVALLSQRGRAMLRVCQ